MRVSTTHTGEASEVFENSQMLTPSILRDLCITLEVSADEFVK